MMTTRSVTPPRVLPCGASGPGERIPKMDGRKAIRLPVWPGPEVARVAIAPHGGGDYRSESGPDLAGVAWRRPDLPSGFRLHSALIPVGACLAGIVSATGFVKCGEGPSERLAMIAAHRGGRSSGVFGGDPTQTERKRWGGS